MSVVVIRPTGSTTPTITGLRIVAVRPMTKVEAAREGWDIRRYAPTVLVLENNSVVYASRDSEGNGPGALFGAIPGVGQVSL